MRRAIVVLAVTLGLAGRVGAQSGFRDVHDVSVGSDYSVLEVRQTPDGGFAAAAGKPMFLLKTDGAGNRQWFQRYDADEATSFDLTSDGGYVLAGQVVSMDDYLVVKTDFSGVPQWSSTYSNNSADQGLYSVRQTSDGGYVASGIWTLRLDSAGVLQWNRLHIGGGGNVNSIRLAADGFVATGEGSYGNPAGDYNLVVSRLDSSGSSVWNKSFGGDGYDWGATVEPTSDGGYIACGWTRSFGAGERDGYLLKLDPNGGMAWARTYGTTGDDVLQGVWPTTDGGYIAAGSMDGQAALVRTDSSGALLWAEAYPASASARSSLFYSVRQTTDDGFIAAGKDESSRLLLVRTDANGSTGGCPQVEPLVVVADAPFLTADNNTNFPGTWTSSARTTTATASTPAVTPCIPSTNRPPSCFAGADVTDACAGLALNDATASDPDGDTLTYSWTSSCPGTTFLASDTVLNPDVLFDTACAVSCDLTLHVDDGHGGTCSDTMHVECAADPAGDCDGDGSANGVDCAPADPTAFAIPTEIAHLDVAKALPSGDGVLAWDSVAGSAGTGTRNDVVGGVISELRADRGFVRAACVAQDVVAATVNDARPLPVRAPGAKPDGYWYLVRAQDACGSGGYGSGSLGPRAIDPALCD